MSKRIEPKIIVKSYDTFDLNQPYFELIKYKCKTDEDNDYLKNILDLMRTTKSITLELFEDVLPVEIFDELKWLKYFQFNAHITVQSEMLLSKYSDCSKNITLNSKLSRNLIILRKENQEEIYLFDNNIRNAYMLIQNIEQVDVHPHFKESLKKAVILTNNPNSPIANIKAFKTLSFGQIHHMDNYENRHVLNKKDLTIFTEDIEQSQNEYLEINDYIYELIKVKNRILISDVYSHDGYITLFRQTNQKLDDAYVIKDKAFCKLINDSKDVDIIEDKLTFEDYENGESITDLSIYKNQLNQFASLNFRIKINPPYLRNFPEYKLSSVYDNVSSIFDNVKNKIKHASELVNSSFPNTKVSKKYIELFLNLVKNLNSTTLLSKFRSLLNEYPNKESIATELRNLYTEDVLNYIRKETIVVNHMNFKSENNISNYDWFMNDIVYKNNASTSSLSRILNLPEDEIRLNSFKEHLLSMIYNMFDYYELIALGMHEIDSLELPQIGVLYEFRNQKLLAIEYEHEIHKAKEYASNIGAVICVKGDET